MPIKPLFLVFLAVTFNFARNTKTEVSGDIFIVSEARVNYKMGAVEVIAIPESQLKPCIEETDAYNTNGKKGAQNDPAISTANGELEKANAELSELERSFDNTTRISADEVDRRIQLRSAVKAKISDARAALDAAQKQLPAFVEKSYSTCFSSVVAAARTQSDGDGKFVLTLPKPGKYVLSASASRSIPSLTSGREVELYDWMVPVDASTGKAISVSLSNNNLTKRF